MERNELLSNSQYGFRRERSTFDTISKMRKLIEEDVRDGDIVLTVGFDIVNASNSLPW